MSKKDLKIAELELALSITSGELIMAKEENKHSLLSLNNKCVELHNCEHEKKALSGAMARFNNKESGLITVLREKVKSRGKEINRLNTIISEKNNPLDIMREVKSYSWPKPSTMAPTKEEKERYVAGSCPVEPPLTRSVFKEEAKEDIDVSVSFHNAFRELGLSEKEQVGVLTSLFKTTLDSCLKDEITKEARIKTDLDIAADSLSELAKSYSNTSSKKISDKAHNLRYALLIDNCNTYADSIDKIRSSVLGFRIATFVIVGYIAYDIYTKFFS